MVDGEAATVWGWTSLTREGISRIPTAGELIDSHVFRSGAQKTEANANVDDDTAFARQRPARAT